MKKHLKLIRFTFNCIRSFLIIIPLLFVSVFAFAQNAGTPDLTFGSTGFVTTSVGSINSMGYAMSVQSDGKIIVAGNSIQNGYAAITLVRYLINGSTDDTFGNNGIVVTQTGLSSGASSIVLQSDNKIIAAGQTLVNDSTFNFTAIRYNPDGSTDNSFGTGGIALINVENSSNAYNAAIQTNGKIVISGYSNINFNTGISLIRLNADGTPDTSFGTDGISIHHFTESPDVEAWAMALDANDKIVTTGLIYDVNLLRNKISIVRFNSDGSLDTGFGTDGIVKTSVSSNSDDFGNAVAIQPDNRIVIAGTSENKAVIARYNINGTPDSSFGTGGIIITDFLDNEAAEAYGITVQNNGKIIAAGVSGTNAMNGNGDFGLIRFNPDGTFDNTFGNNGKVTTDISNGNNDVAFSVKEHTDGKLVVSGISKTGNYYNFAVARYNGTSVQIPEYSINENINIFPNPALDKIEITGIENGFFEIINIHKQVVFSSLICRPLTVVDISKIAGGIYITKIKTDDEIIIKKLIIQ